MYPLKDNFFDRGVNSPLRVNPMEKGTKGKWLSFLTENLPIQLKSVKVQNLTAFTKHDKCCSAICLHVRNESSIWKTISIRFLVTPGYTGS